MAFADAFADCMTQNGLTIDAGYVPDGDSLKGAMDYFASQLASQGDLLAGLNEVTKEGFAKIFSDPEMGLIDSAYDAVLDAFDSASGMPIETAIQWCQHCIEQANAAGEG